MSHQLDERSRRALKELNYRLAAEAHIKAIAKVASALAEGKIIDHNVTRLQKTVCKQTTAQIALLAPELGEAMKVRIDKQSQGDKLARDLPIPEPMQRQAKMAFGPQHAYLQTITTEGERYENLPSDM